MFIQLLERLNTMILPEDQKLKFFYDRTNMHIGLVKEAAAMIVNVFPELAPLLPIVELHDSTKFEEPEMSPYISLTWNKAHGGTTSTDEMTQATLHHIKNNAHHPEYHLEDKTSANLSSTNRDESIECIDATSMDFLSLAEMVADWQAMAVELGTNTARQWYNKVKNVRWHFDTRQDVFIDSILKVFEEKER